MVKLKSNASLATDAMAEVETKRKAAEPETKRAIEDLIQIYICPDNFCDFGSAHMSPETVCCS